MAYRYNIFFNCSWRSIKVGEKLKNILEYCCKSVLILEKFNSDVEVSVLFTDNEEIKKLNNKYRNKDCATDVLSFPTENSGRYSKHEGVVVLGDIVISVERAVEQFKVFGCSCFEEEMARLTIHSMLHLLGYDHEKDDLSAKIMSKKEKILNSIVRYKFKFERV